MGVNSRNTKGRLVNTFDAMSLISARRNIQTPFQLQVHKPGTGQVALSVLSILRLLPARRIVALAEFEGERVLVKTFLGRSADKYAFRERMGVQAIANSGVSTPELLWEGSMVPAESGRVLVFRYLPDAVSLAEQWIQSRDSDTRIDILAKAMHVIAKLHDHGVVQNDIHLANFLVSESRLYTIDGGAVGHKGEQRLNENVSLKNLAMFFAQFYPRYDDLISKVIGTYEAQRSWQADPGRAKRFLEEVGRSRQMRKRHYLEKTVRDCTQFVCKARFRRFEVCERISYTDELARLIADPDRFIENGRILKSGNSATVAMVRLSDRALVIKKYNIKNVWHGTRRLLRESRARSSWGNAHRLEFLGIPALKPVAMIENRIGPFRTSAYLITEFIEGPDALSLKGMKHTNNEPEALGQILQELSAAQVSHGDMKATNFMLTEAGPVMIDLDGMIEHNNPGRFKRAFARDLSRFMDNWKDDPELEARFSSVLRDLSAQYGLVGFRHSSKAFHQLE